MCGGGRLACLEVHQTGTVALGSVPMGVGAETAVVQESRQRANPQDPWTLWAQWMGLVEIGLDFESQKSECRTLRP